MKRKLPVQSEESVQLQLCHYLRYQYPGVIFESDMSGVYIPKMTIGAAQALKKMTLLRSHPRGVPDTRIWAQRLGYGALLIEVKKPGTNLVTQRIGTVRSVGEWIDEHVQEQAKYLNDSFAAGYWTTFGIGFPHVKRIIDSYMNGDKIYLEGYTIRQPEDVADVVKLIHYLKN